MGKKKWYKWISDPQPARIRVGMPRNELEDVIGKSIYQAELASFPENPFPSEGLREVARTAEKVDWGSWQCKDSCGCPMTLWGVTLVRNWYEMPTNPEDMPDSVRSFYESFDRQMFQRFGYKVGTITVLD